MFEVGSAVARIKADMTNFNQGMTEARNQANGLGDTIGKVGAGIANFAQQSAVFAGVVGAGIGLAAKTGLESAAKFEQYQIAFTTLLKDQKKAAEAIKNIQEDAAKTPFELAPLVAANQRLISAGINADAARKDILNLGDAISATGGGGAELERLSTNLQQIKAVGKATALDIKQFAFAGINVYQLLADATGKNVDQVKDMDVSYELLSKAFEKASGTGGMFEGAMVKQSKSLNGLISTLKDTVSLGLKDILMNSGIFAAIRDGVAGLIPAFENAATQLTRFFIVISNGISYLQSIMAGENVMDEVREFISYFMGGEMPGEDHPAVQFMYKLAEVLKAIGEWISTHQELVLTFLKGLAIGIGALLIIGGITALVTALLNPLTLVVLAIAALYTAWQTNFLGIQDISRVVFAELSNIFNNFIMPLIQLLTNFVKEHWEEIKLITQGVWSIIKGIIQVAWGVIYGILAVGLALFTGDWEAAWEAIKHSAELVWTGLKNIFNGALDFIKGWGSSLIKTLTQPFEDAWAKIKETIDKIKDGLDFTKRHSPSVVDIVTRGVSLVNKAFEDLPMGGSAITGSASPAFLPTSGGGVSPTYLTIDLSGAIIADEASAQRISEMVGDNIIRKLQTNIRM